jgi:hypothetical protein
LLENKVCLDQVPAGNRSATGNLPSPPWVIGWFGTLRCRRSLEILSAVAASMGNHVSIEIRGLPSHEDITAGEIAAVCRRHSNIRYFGPYESPADLSEIYSRVHFSWCIDFLDAGANSDWLLPNRMYEGALYGAVALARQGTATGRAVEHADLGWTLSQPTEGALQQLLMSLTPAGYERKRAAVEANDRSRFVDETDTKALLDRLQTIAASPA